MAAQNRHIALVTDNCPSHPRPNSPPKAYCGPPPPVLTHVVLVYLPKNTTPFFQPLDQGIIRSFKASYRRKYAQKMVHYFNEHQKASPQLNILEAIYLIVPILFYPGQLMLQDKDKDKANLLGVILSTPCVDVGTALPLSCIGG